MNKRYLALGLLLAFVGATPITAMATEQTAFDELLELYENSEEADVDLKFSLLKYMGFYRIALNGICYSNHIPDTPNKARVMIKKKPCTPSHGQLFDNSESYCPQPFIDDHSIDDSDPARTFKYIHHEGQNFLLEKMASSDGVEKICHYEVRKGFLFY